MRLLEKIVDNIIYSRFYLALGAMFQAYAFVYLFGLEAGVLFGLFMLSTIMAAYNLNRYSDREEDEVNIGGSSNKAVYAFYIGLISLLVAIVSAILSYPWLLISLVILMSLLAIYSVDLFPSYFRYNRLKDIPFVKNTIVGAAWAFFFVSSIVVLGGEIGIFLAIIFVFNWFRVFISSVMSDMRDIKGDREAGVNTLPVLYGIGKAKNIILVLNLVITLISYGSIAAGFMPQSMMLPALVNIFGFPIIYYINQDNVKKASFIIKINETFIFALLTGIWMVIV